MCALIGDQRQERGYDESHSLCLATIANSWQLICMMI
jgi:hypothetical protein